MPSNPRHGDTPGVNIHLGRAFARVVRDLEATGVPVPRVEPADWQDHRTAEPAYLWSASGSGMGIWVDTALAEADQVAMVAEQVQEFMVEELPGLHLPSNWPRCPGHPENHPMTALVQDGKAHWSCPATRDPVVEVGALTS